MQRPVRSRVSKNPDRITGCYQTPFATESAMTTEAYIPAAVTFAGRPIAEVFAVTLYDPDSDDPHGSMTTHQPLPAGQRGGPLLVEAARGGQRWRIALPEIEVLRSTAVGFEFIVFGRILRTLATTEGA